MSLSKSANRRIEFLDATPSSFTNEFTLAMVEAFLCKHFGDKKNTVGGYFMTKDANGKSAFNKTKVDMYIVDKYPDVRFLEIIGRNDAFLQNQAIKWNMPRGFPVFINIRTGEVSPSGFFGKFMNDKGQTESFSSENDGVTGLHVTRKWSGFLTGTAIYQINPELIGCIVVSKKSADPASKYVNGGLELWRKILSAKVVWNLWEKDIRSIWAETMTTWDQCHGAKVQVPHLIITGAGQLIGPDAIRSSVLCGKRLESILKSVELERYCAKTIIVPPHIDAFLLEIANSRDMMTETMFQTVLRKFDLCTDSLHLEILGDVLEGLILLYIFHTEERIEKYKFAGYTFRTMFIRACSSGGGTSNSDTKFNSLGFKSDGTWSLSCGTVNAALRFVERWVFDDNAREYYLGLALAVGPIYDEHLQLYDGNDPTSVGPWITATDKVNEEIVSGLVIKPISITQFKNSVPSLQLFVICGWVGCGKSTIGRMLSDQFDIPHLDGDILNTTVELVDMLNRERNNATLSLLACMLAIHGKGSISTGAGALGRGKKENWEFTVARDLERMTGRSVFVTVIVPSTKWSMETPLRLTEVKVIDGIPVGFPVFLQFAIVPGGNAEN